MNSSKAKKKTGDHPQWYSCRCFVCGREDAVLRTTQDGFCSVMLCDGHYADYALRYFTASLGCDTIVVMFAGIDVPFDTETFLDKEAFVNLFIRRVVHRR